MTSGGRILQLGNALLVRTLLKIRLAYQERIEELGTHFERQKALQFRVASTIAEPVVRSG